MAAQITTPFIPLFPRRSDGKEIITQRGTSIKNRPNAQQLDKTPNAQGQSDYYRLIDYDEPKHLDWRKKLGGMLLREIGGKQYEDKWQQCLLWDLPNGYCLYEHIKSKADGQTKPKNHSGGGHDRQDAYLYGHPKGPKKRFRSPVEFFPHLLWLSTDETNDAENCTCKLCSPLQLEEPEKPATPVQQVLRNPIVQIPTQQPAQNAFSASSAAAAQSQAVPVVNNPSQLPQPRCVDQQVDGQYGKFLLRVGELTWYVRDAGAWGLGLVTRRWSSKQSPSGTPQAVYTIMPLSYPGANQVTAIVSGIDNLKPWLAWSPPQCTYPWLRDNPSLRYQQVDWHALMRTDTSGQGIAEVDSSILAAKYVDCTYTLFERLKTAIVPNGDQERHYNGIYLGAEKIWNGEPVRVHIGTGNTIMVITSIIERVANPSNSNQSNTPPVQVQVTGDLYEYSLIPVSDPNSPPTPPANPNLPLRMREDMRWCNQTLVPQARSFAYWKLVHAQARINISDIKGRWYETSLYYVEEFRKSVQDKLGGVGSWLNARGDCYKFADGKRGPLERVEERLTAFGVAVPRGTGLVEGVDVPQGQQQQQLHQQAGVAAEPPTQTQTMPQQQNVEMGNTGVSGGESGFALDDFMNLEGIGDDNMQVQFDDNFTAFGQGNGGGWHQ